MRGVTLISLLAALEQVYGQDSVHYDEGREVADKFLDRALTVSPLQDADLDGTTVGKSGHASTLSKPVNLASPMQMRLRPPLQVRHAQPYAVSYMLPSPVASYRPQVPLREMPSLSRRQVQAKADGFGSEPSKPEASTAPASDDGPEEIAYEGPPAISDAILPSFAIPTIVGLIPATAAWSRQAWVRFKITNKGVRTTGGFGGNDVQEFPYSKVRKLRSVKRLFGDGDLIFTLQGSIQGSQVNELRNVPNFDTVRDFILKYLPSDVVDEYKSSQSER
jgi:hypothetical protein